MAELRPYTPSWRDRVAAMLMGDVRASPERARVVEGLFGSRGLGSTGASLADATPIGSVFSANELTRAETPVEALFAAAGLLPAAASVWRGGASAARSLARASESAGSDAVALGSRTARLYNPPTKPNRPFSADYPSGAMADDAGKLTRTIDGQEIGARFVVGRTHVGGSDAGLPTSAYDALAEAATGRHPEAVARRQIGGDAGRYLVTRDRRSGDVLSRDILVDKGLEPSQLERVLLHEISHAIDERSGSIKTNGLNSELKSIYNDLNNPSPYGKKLGPDNNGYFGGDINKELVAEAIRAYLIDPNYIKTAAPGVADRIRQSVNSNPQINKIVQFNGVAAPIAGGLLGMPTPDDGYLQK